MVTYSSADIYIESATTIKAKIARINAVIDALHTTALRAAAGDDVSEYSLNDGQIQIKQSQRSAESILKSITSFEAIKQLYINQLTGRAVRLVDGKNFTGNTHGRS